MSCEPLLTQHGFSPGRDLIDALPGPPCTAPLDRRAFIKMAAALPCLAAALPYWSREAFALPNDDWGAPFEARYYQKLEGKAVRCKLCPRECMVSPGNRGYCRVRENRGGTYYSLSHSRIVAAHIDPIEKKPFFHFLPGSLAFSVATPGCNVNCKFCQNWEISQPRPEELRSVHVPPKELAERAKASGCPLLAYTYTEPVVFNEYVVDAAEAGHAAGLRSVVVSNGFIQQEPLKRLCQSVDAIKTDVKAFSEKYYREVVRGELKPVLDTVVTVRKHGRWSEIVYLVVPTLNDSDAEFRGLARWIKSEVGADIPVHFTRFHPLYLLTNLPPTPVETLERAKAVADAEGLQYVYVGNVPGHPAENTYCPKCRHLLIERAGFTIRQMHVQKGKCEYCKQPIPGIWKT
jgi:pyruvate formate lyase activating enzyme